MERVLPAAIDDVFAAWTEPASMARWLSPTGHAEVEADVRPGGRLRVVMIGDGRRIEHTGEYVTIDPPRLLSFTWQSPYTGDTPSMVTVHLSVHDEERTHLVLVHERLPDETAGPHKGGWTAILGNLATVLAAPDGHRIPKP